MKRILLLFLPFLPYLATAQVAKDTVTVLTLAQIPAGAIRDTTNLTFVQDNAFAKATFDSLAKYTRVKLIGDRGDITVSGSTGLTWELDAGVVDSMQLSAGAVVLPGAKVTGTLPVGKGGTGNQTGLAATATALATGRTIQTNLASTSSATFDGTANITPGVTGTLPVGNGGTGAGAFTQGSVVFAGAGGVYSQNNSGLFWDNSNNGLGIGTTNPTGKLMLYQSTAGNVFENIVSNQGGTTQVGVNLSPSMNDSEIAANPAQASIYAVDNNFSANIIFATKNSGAVGNALAERMRITSGGNVGIGTTPAVQFHTTGGVRFAGLATSGTSTYTVKADATGNLWYDSSDESYKKNISAIPYGIAAVMQLNPVAYNFVEDDEPDLGFIAQDIYNIIPELTYTAQDGKFGVKYDKLVSVLTKAIQEQQAQIEQLKQRITQLENK